MNPRLNSKCPKQKIKKCNLELSKQGYPTAFSNFTMNGSKWYMEATPFNMTDTGGLYIGLCDDQMISNAITVETQYPGGPGGVAYGANGTIADNKKHLQQSTYLHGGDVIGVAYDADNGKVYFAKNGVYINDGVYGENPHHFRGYGYFVVGAYENRNVL